MNNRTGLEADLVLAFGPKSDRKFRFQLTSDSRRIAICGPSGVGKSTFLKALAGIETRVTGFLRFGRVIWTDSSSEVFVPSSKRRVGWVPQNALLFPHLSVQENLLFAPGARVELAEEISVSVRIEHLLNRMPRNLSGGERSRVALARALVAEPNLLLLDEPFFALNDSLRTDVMLFLARHCIEKGLSVVLATHRQSEAAALCDEVVNWDSSLEMERFATQKLFQPAASPI